MDRQEFLKICGGACLSLTGLSLVQACHPTKYIQSSVENAQIKIPQSEFLIPGKTNKYRRSLICQVPSLDFPLVIYRLSADRFRALLMRCSHQGYELSMHGDILSCSAHGSEFGSDGEVLQGPAESSLQSFKVTSDHNTLYVHVS